MSKTIDRIAYAAQLSRGKRVLDIGGQKMPGCNPEGPFARAYARIEKAASDYRIVDYQAAPQVDYRIDLNQADSSARLHAAIDEFQPELILCMEILEHINYHFECLQEMAYAVRQYGSTVFITVPNNGNWIFNALGWNGDHCIAFFGSIAERFIKRSELGAHPVTMHPCMQKYVWYWWMVYALSGFQPFSWGFTIRPKADSPGNGRP